MFVCLHVEWTRASQEANAQPIFHGQLPCRLLSATRDSQTALLTVSVALHTLHSHQKQQALVFHITDEVQGRVTSRLVCECMSSCAGVGFGCGCVHVEAWRPSRLIPPLINPPSFFPVPRAIRFSCIRWKSPRPIFWF